MTRPGVVLEADRPSTRDVRSTPTGADRRSVRWHILIARLPLVIVVLAVLDYVLALVRPGTRPQVWLYWTAVWATPVWLTGMLLMVVLPAVVLVGRRSGTRPAVVDAAVTVLFGLYCFGTRISPPTGDQLGWWKGAATNTIAASETLADLAHKVPYWMTHDLNSVRLVSPVFGIVTIAAYLVLARRLALTTTLSRDLLRVFAIATPLPFWFVAGYIENTFLGLPFMLLALERLLAHLRTPRPRTLVQVALLIGLAAAFHLLFLVIAGGAAVALALLRRGSARFVDRATVLAGALLVPAAAVGILLLTPMRVFPGNTNGGYDEQLLTPWVLHAGEWPNRFTMLSHAHAIEVANILVQAAPALVLALPVVLIAARRRREERPTRPTAPATVETVLAVLSSAYFAFVAVFGFDYGPVGNLDLMLVLSVPFSLFVLLVTARLVGRRSTVLVGLVLASVVIQFAFYTLKVATAWAA